MAKPKKITGIPYIDYAIDDARKYISRLLGMQPTRVSEDVVLADIMKFPYMQVTPINHVPYGSIIKPQMVEDIVDNFQESIIATYNEIIQDISALGSNGSLSAESMTLSNGSTPIVDALNELKNYISSEQGNVKGLCNQIIQKASERRNEEVREFRKLFQKRIEFLSNRIKKAQNQINIWQDEITSIDILDVIPAHMIASRISYMNKISEFREGIERDTKEIDTLKNIGERLGAEVMTV